MYTAGTTCSNLTEAVYLSGYDAYGNVTSRTYSGTTATLPYDTLGHFTEWNAGSTNREWYLYDGAGNRVLRRTINRSSITMRVYTFGLEEHTHGSAGANLSNTYYYLLGGPPWRSLGPIRRLLALWGTDWAARWLVYRMRVWWRVKR